MIATDDERSELERLQEVACDWLPPWSFFLGLLTGSLLASVLWWFAALPVVDLLLKGCFP